MAICDTYLSDIDTSFDEAHWILDTFLTPDKEWFDDNYGIHAFDQEWRTHIKTMVTSVENIISFLIHGNYLNRHPFRLPYFLTNCVGGEEIDMSAILTAMENAEPHQPLLFVGLTEAYYASVWNASFDENFYAELVKKWSIWQ